MPVYEIEWRHPAYQEQIIRTQWRGSTPSKAVENALKTVGGVQAHEVAGWGSPIVRELNEDGELVEASSWPI